MATGRGSQFPGYTDRIGRGRRACRDHPLVWAAGMPRPKSIDEPILSPVVNLEFHQISNRGKNLPLGADEFTIFLKTHIASWAGRAGVP